ncbi:MAG TPA: sigma-54-dependent Fis family transcriptional regulator [Bacteroidetes bacterium]|nr:sigma-54-dependent Fis family transcriptional regulator [Bacteroidota bacterium]
MKSKHSANVVIVGAGRGGTALLEILNDDPTTNILGVVDVNPEAKGIGLAKKLGIKVSKYANTFLENKELKIDILLEVTGSKKIQEELRRMKSPDTRMIAGIAAKYIWSLIETQKDKRIIEQKYLDLKASLGSGPGDELIFGTNPIMQQIKLMISQVAPTPASVLITGETGTGKEMIASTLQQSSHLKNEPFVKINCTAFPPHLLESELFGYKKGAFTGATKDKSGLLEKGDGGTIFLDEIGDVSLDMQVKMLRFLQFGEIRPVGSTETKIVNCRIIAATNRNLEKLIEEEKFRKDLYYRLNSFIIELPPLRDRKEDIPVLAYHFLKHAVNKLNKKVSTISTRALERLTEYAYPGNLRELQSIMERAVILCQGDEIGPSLLPVSVQSSEVLYDYKKGLQKAKEETVSQFERQAVLHYMTTAKGNVTQAAMMARVPRRTFYRMMEKHNISKNYFKKLNG